MENRFKTSYSNGNQLYVCIPCLYFRSTVRIRNPDGCSINRRYCGRTSGTFCKILDKSYLADCSSNGCYGNRILTSFCWCGFLRRRNGSSRFWFCQQLDTWNCNPCKLHFIQYTCKRLFKTAFCFIRTCCGIYCGTLYGSGGFFSTS